MSDTLTPEQIAEETAVHLRAALRKIDSALHSILYIDSLGSGSPETTLSRRRLQEARFWLIEHGHGSWVES